jgi:Mg-chelatase subunit ChlD
MKRLTLDVPRWDVYLHREARQLPAASSSDTPRQQLEDELFERLYAGETDPLGEKQEHRRHADWARRVHAQCDQLPAFGRLTTECRGDAAAAATALESLLGELGGVLDEAKDELALRRSVRQGCVQAARAVEEMREARQGLEHVGLVSTPGTGTIHGAPAEGMAAVQLARRLRSDHRLKRIALLAGRFKRIAASKRRQRVRHGADEISDIEQGADLGRLIPAELVKLAHPRLRLVLRRDLVERQALQYALHGTETLGRGPLVVCLDKSGSMEGDADLWATAVALALLDQAQRERRAFVVLGFDGAVKAEHRVEPGSPLPVEALFTSCGGGTNIDTVIDRALAIISERKAGIGRADVVLISDGVSKGERAAEVRGRAEGLGVTVLGVGIGITADSLSPWCDEATSIRDLHTVEGEAADLLFKG